MWPLAWCRLRSVGRVYHGVSFSPQDVPTVVACPAGGRSRSVGTDVSFSWHRHASPVGGSDISEAHDLGIAKWQVEAILSASQDEVKEPNYGRQDLPVAYSGRRANFGMAVAAGQPNNRKRSLELLDADILARTTNPSHEARLRTYLALCSVWSVTPWPLSFENIRAFGASLKSGGYRSAGIYFQSLCSHQQRVLHTPVPPMIRHCIKDCVRSIKRGLGITRLKDGFPALGLALIPFLDDGRPFDLSCKIHTRDMAVIATWFMHA